MSVRSSAQGMVCHRRPAFLQCAAAAPLAVRLREGLRIVEARAISVHLSNGEAEATWRGSRY